MDINEFEIKVGEIVKRNPKLLALESDKKADFEMILDIENYYGLKFPEDYVDFLMRYGGGYFGFVAVFSCDPNGNFYMKNNVSKSWVEEKNFLPFVDLETGDFIGFVVRNKVCSGEIVIYLHEEDEFSELNRTFFDVILKYGFNAV